MRDASSESPTPRGFLAGKVISLDVSIRGVALVAAALLLMWLTIRLWPVLVLVIAAFVLMAALLPFVNWLMARGLGRVAASMLTIAILLLGIVALLATTVPSLAVEFGNIDENLPTYAGELDRLLSSLGFDASIEERARNFDVGASLSGSAAQVGEPAVVALASLLTVVVLTAYLLVDVPRLSQFIFHFVPRGREAEITELLASVRRVVGGYVRGQAITSACIATFTFVVLLAVGAPNPLAFAVLAGFADIIPLVGAFIAIVPATVATVGVSMERALIVLVLLVLYQQFEDRFLMPKVYGAALGLPPLVVFLVVLAGAQLFGIVGVLLALPAVAAARVVLEYMSQHDALVPSFAMSELGDEVAAPDDTPPAARELAEDRGVR